jgi:sugar lactone lactonase YvrE
MGKMRPSFASLVARLARVVALLPLALLLITCSGCVPQGDPSQPDLVIGSRGIGPGRFQKPRAITIDSEDRIYVVDMTGRIQVLSSEGEPLALWRTPEIYQGKPTGLTISPTGNLLVADTHYSRILQYQPDGTHLEKHTLGGTHGLEPGEFGLVTDIAIDSQGNQYISEYGELDRIQKFSPEGEFLFQWGGSGTEPGQFERPNNLAVDENDHLWVVDACNHRIQVFDATGDEAKLIKSWGTYGSESGQLSYPYDLVLGHDGFVYIAEYGNHRVQKFTRDGQWQATWGTNGKEPGQLYQPWGLAQDSKGRLYVLDSYNHRIQRFRL